MSRLAVAAALALVAGTALAAQQPLSRYQSIIDRQMFGAPPTGFDPDKNPNEVAGGKNAEKELTKEQEKLQSSIHFSMINITPSGETAVGFTDNSDGKQPVHYYLKVGEKRNGWEVKEADPVRAWMRIAKGDIEVELELGGNSAAKDANGATTRAAADNGASAKPQTASILPATPRNTLLGGLRGRRMARAAEAAELEKRAAEERARQEEERAAQKEELMLMKEEIQLQREEREEELRRLEEDRRREEDFRRREEDLQRREEEAKAKEHNDEGPEA